MKFKKITSLLLTSAMVVSLLAGCGSTGSDNGAAAPADKNSSAATTQTASTDSGEAMVIDNFNVAAN